MLFAFNVFPLRVFSIYRCRREFEAQSSPGFIISTAIYFRKYRRRISGIFIEILPYFFIFFSNFLPPLLYVQFSGLTKGSCVSVYNSTAFVNGFTIRSIIFQAISTFCVSSILFLKSSMQHFPPRTCFSLSFFQVHHGIPFLFQIHRFRFQIPLILA